MSRTREIQEVPPNFNEGGNPITVEEDFKMGASNAPTLEELMRLEKLTVENNKIRRKAKGKKTKGDSSSSEDEDSSLEEDVSKKGKKGRNNHDKPSYNSMSFNYDYTPSTIAYTSIPIGKAPYFDGTCYNQWKHCMKNYLYSIALEVWQVVCDGVEFSNEDEQPTLDQLEMIHCSAQTISILTTSIDKEEFNQVDGFDVAKDVWNTLRMAHEGSRPMRKAKLEKLEGQLNCFIMYNDETPHEMLNRLKKLVNKARALGSKKWIDHMLIERSMMAYTPMNYNVVTMIHQDRAYKKMSSDDVIGRIMNQEMNIQEANNMKNLFKGVSTSKK
jgi:hypothetical protein